MRRSLDSWRPRSGTPFTHSVSLRDDRGRLDEVMAIATVFARGIASLVGAEGAGYTSQHAGIAQLVEHNLAKVGVAGSSPVCRSAGPIDRNGGGPEPLPFPFPELVPTAYETSLARSWHVEAVPGPGWRNR